MGTLEKALPGRQHAKDWLTLKIVECLSQPMDKAVSEELSFYNGAYNAVCQWSSSDKRFSKKDADEWTKEMQNEDGTNGPHWTFEQATQIAQEREIQIDPLQFWAALCMVYSDYSTVAVKYKLGENIEFYIDLAKAFLNDKDAPKDKLSRYYNFIVRG